MKRERRAKGGKIPDSSMSDIAFLLLIFFLVTTTVDMDKGLGIILPAEGETFEMHRSNILNCLINSTGGVLLGDDPVEVKDISRLVKDKMAENDNLIISVKSHERTSYEDYIGVIDQLKKANAKISIAETG